MEFVGLFSCGHFHNWLENQLQSRNGFIYFNYVLLNGDVIIQNNYIKVIMFQ